MKRVNDVTQARPCRWLGAAAMASLLASIASTTLGGCGGVASKSPTVGGESHFLQYCDQTCGDGLDCIVGVCTRGCLVSDASSCSEFSTAACTSASVEPGAVGVCDVACSDNSDCEAVGRQHRCESGFCRAPRAAGGDSTANGGAAGTASGGTGGGAAMSGSGGTGASADPPVVDCSLYRTAPDVQEIEFILRNERSETIYVTPIALSCGGGPIAIYREGRLVDISGGGCGLSCERVQDDGNPQYEGSTGTACPSDCLPPPLVRLEPGGEHRDRVRALEVAFQQMPDTCFTGDFPSVTCFTQLRLPSAQYTTSLTGYTDFSCFDTVPNCECTPDENGICSQYVNLGAGQTLTASATFQMPAMNAEPGAPVTSVTLAFVQD